MLDFYEGEALRRTILIRNAMRRTSSYHHQQEQQQQQKQKQTSDAELFYGDLQSSSSDAEQQSTTQPRRSAPLRVQVTDYDYDVQEDENEVQVIKSKKTNQMDIQSTELSEDEYDYDDETEDEMTSGEEDEDDQEMLIRHGHIVEGGVRLGNHGGLAANKDDEHSWFDDLLDEVSIEENMPRTFVKRVHPADVEETISSGEEEEDGNNTITTLSSIESSIESLSINSPHINTYNSSANSSITSTISLPSLVEDDNDESSSGGSSADEYDVDEDRSSKYIKSIKYTGGVQLSTIKSNSPIVNHHLHYTTQPSENFLHW